MLTIIATIQKDGFTGGTVECPVCRVRWECDTVAKCGACEKLALCDVEGGEDNACCVECLTYMGDGVKHYGGGCDGPPPVRDPFPHVHAKDAQLIVASLCDDAAALGDVAGLRAKAARWAKRADRLNNAQARLIGEAMKSRAEGIRYRLAGRIEDAGMMERLSERQIQHLRHTTGGR